MVLIHLVMIEIYQLITDTFLPTLNSSIVSTHEKNLKKKLILKGYRSTQVLAKSKSHRPELISSQKTVSTLPKIILTLRISF